MRTQIDIKKFKLRDQIFADITYEERSDEHIPDMVVKICNNPIHEDLRATLQKLSIHCVLICEMIESNVIKGPLEKYQHKILETITVRGFSISKKDGTAVIIFFTRKLKSGKAHNTNTPLLKFDDEESVYRFDRELQTAFIDLEQEVTDYLQFKKVGVKQLSLDLPKDEGGTASQEEHPDV